MSLLQKIAQTCVSVESISNLPINVTYPIIQVGSTENKYGGALIADVADVEKKGFRRKVWLPKKFSALEDSDLPQFKEGSYYVVYGGKKGSQYIVSISKEANNKRNRKRASANNTEEVEAGSEEQVQAKRKKVVPEKESEEELPPNVIDVLDDEDLFTDFPHNRWEEVIDRAHAKQVGTTSPSTT